MYLTENKDGKVLNLINGMDRYLRIYNSTLICFSVPHDDVLPLNIVPPCSSEEFKSPIEHDLFSTLFKMVDEKKPGLFRLVYSAITVFRTWI